MYKKLEDETRVVTQSMSLLYLSFFVSLNVDSSKNNPSVDLYVI